MSRITAAVLSLAVSLAAGSAFADDMGRKDSMGMKKDAMEKKPMKKKKDSMHKDGMGMKKDSMEKKDPMAKDKM